MNSISFVLYVLVASVTAIGTMFDQISGLLGNVVQSLGQVDDVVKDVINNQILPAVRPSLKQKVEERVAEFSNNIQQQIPRDLENHLTNAKEQNDTITTSIISLVGDKIPGLVEKFLELMQPEVARTTSGVSDQITDYSIDTIQAVLHLEDANQAASNANEAPSSAPFIAGALQSVLQLGGVEQPELEPSTTITSRSLPTNLAPGVESPGFLSAVGAVAGRALNLDQKLQRLPAAVREHLQPVSAMLKQTLWDIIPPTFSRSVDVVIDRVDNMSLADGDSVVDNVLSAVSNLTETLQDKVLDKIGDRLKEVLPRVVESFRPSIQELIAKLVDVLESECVEAADTKTRTVLANLNLLDSSPPQESA